MNWRITRILWHLVGTAIGSAITLFWLTPIMSLSIFVACAVSNFVMEAIDSILEEK